MREVSFKYVVVRNGSDFCELYTVGDPTIRMNDSGEIKLSLSGEFVDDDSVNWLSDEIRVEMTVDGTTHQLGVFVPGTVRHIKDDTTKSVEVDAYDQCWLIKDHYTESLEYFQTGDNYIDIITNLLTQCGIAFVSAVPNAATLAEDREDWDIGTSYLTIINQLLSEINYKQLWFNADGVAIIEPVSVPTAANIQHTISNKNAESFVVQSINRETDIYNAPNVFICICSNADKSAPMVATSENTNPQSALSIMRRGRRIATVQNVDNIASQAELQAYADDLRNKSMVRSEKITIRTALFPGYGVDDVTALEYDDDVFDICVEKAWIMQLKAGGTMSHTLEKVVIALE